MGFNPYFDPEALQQAIQGVQGAASAAAQVPGQVQAAQAQAQAPGQGFDAGAVTSPQDPLAALMQGSVRYQQQHRGQDPLAEAAARGMLGSGGGRPGSGVNVPRQVVDESATGLNHVAALSSHGPRQGQAHLTFDLGNGTKANVYYDSKGRRRVFTYAA